MEARFTTPVQTDPGAHTASCTISTRVSLPGVKWPGRGVDHPPPSSTKVKERVELYPYSPSGPSWPGQGDLFFTFYVIQHSYVKVTTSTYRRNYWGSVSVIFNMTDQLDKHISWKNHINKMLPKLSSACFVVGSMYSYSNVSILKIIYFAYFHTTMDYVFIFLGNSKDSQKTLSTTEKYN